jgi:hypothetical protein
MHVIPVYEKHQELRSTIAMVSSDTSTADPLRKGPNFVFHKLSI